MYVQEAGNVGEYGDLRHWSLPLFQILNHVYSLLGEKVKESGRFYSNLQTYYSKYSFPEVCLKLLLLITCLIGAGFIYRIDCNDIYKNSWGSVYVHAFFQLTIVVWDCSLFQYTTTFHEYSL